MRILLIHSNPNLTKTKNYRFSLFNSLLEKVNILCPSLAFPQLAAVTPEEHEVVMINERYKKIDFESDYDIVGITAMTNEIVRAYEIADTFRKKNTGVQDFLVNNPFIYLDKNKLKGLILTNKEIDHEEIQRMGRKYFLPNLTSLSVLSLQEFLDKSPIRTREYYIDSEKNVKINVSKKVIKKKSKPKTRFAVKINYEEIEKVISRIVSERIDFVKKRGLTAINPLMGVIMKELRGKVDGKKVSDILKKEIEKRNVTVL